MKIIRDTARIKKKHNKNGAGCGCGCKNGAGCQCGTSLTGKKKHNRKNGVGCGCNCQRDNLQLFCIVVWTQGFWCSTKLLHGTLETCYSLAKPQKTK